MPADPLAWRRSTVYWLLRVDWPVRPLRWATRPVNILDEDGVLQQHIGGLSVDFDFVLDAFGSSPAVPRVGLPGLLLPPGLDIGAQVARGNGIDGVAAEVALWCVGDDYNERLVMARGRIRLPTYGAPGEPVEMSFEAEGLTDTERVIGARQRVTIPNWSMRRGSDAKRAYPRIYGAPGSGKDLVSLYAAADAGIDLSMVTIQKIGASTLLLAGHEIDASAVMIYYSDPINLPLQAIPQRTTDLRGQVVTVVADASFDEEMNFYADFSGFQTIGGGMRSSYIPGSAMYGAGEIIEDLLALSTAQVDRGRFGAARQLLDRFKLDFYIDDPEVSPLEFITDHILPVLPASLVTGPDGVYPVIWLPDEQPVSADLVEGVHIRREGLIEYESEPLNEIRLSYGPKMSTGADFYYSTTVSGEYEDGTAVTTQDTVISSVYARASVSRYGQVYAKEIDTIVVRRHDTAAQIVLWMARAFAFAHRIARYSTSRDIAVALQIGDHVRVTDPGVSMAPKRGMVRGIRWADLMPEIEVLFLDDVVLDDAVGA